MLSGGQRRYDHSIELPIMAEKCPIDHASMTPEQLQKAAQAYRFQQDSLSPAAAPPQSAIPQTSLSSDARPACDSNNQANIVGDNFPDSKPHAEQRLKLSSAPVESNIPRGGADSTGNSYNNWVFPSPQRFYNAMKKKGWAPNELDMPFVVSIHNTVNEQAWKKVLSYENFHKNSCNQPKLLKFRGRPNDLSPKAQFLSFFGYIKPFDRHDWVVDRCGEEIRYILDFYEGPNVANLPAAIHIDVRPAVSAGGVIDRVRMTFNEWFGKPPQQ
jgi:cytochrome c heme-lyase